LIAEGSAPERNVVDSSGWLEYLADGSNGPFFADVLLDLPKLIVPSISIFEVFRKMLRERGKERALEAAGVMRGGRVIDLDVNLAVNAARLGELYKLPLADSVIYATAQAHDAVLWTQDAHFEGLPEVRYQPKQRGG
jgi:predicted nucleic acid-binding protein